MSEATLSKEIELAPPAAELSATDALILEHVHAAVRAAEDKKAADPVVLRLTALTEFTDYFIICTGGNPRQVQAIADEVTLRLKKDYKVRPLNTEGYNKAEWILLDYGTFVFHVFVEESRRFYDLERLWRDAERVTLEA
jgi:ribosome-associated protein